MENNMSIFQASDEGEIFVSEPIP